MQPMQSIGKEVPSQLCCQTCLFYKMQMKLTNFMPRPVECWVDQNPGLGGPIPTFIGNIQTLRKLACLIYTEACFVHFLIQSSCCLHALPESWSITRCGFTGPIPSELGNLRNLGRLTTLWQPTAVLIVLILDFPPACSTNVVVRQHVNRNSTC